jgi:excisionase family DNA binding protein
MERMSTETQMRPLLKVGEVAEWLNLPESTVRRRIEMGDLPALRLGSGPQSPVRIDPTALEAWLDQRLSSSSPKPLSHGFKVP